MTDDQIEAELRDIFTKWKANPTLPFIAQNALEYVSEQLQAQGYSANNSRDHAGYMINRMINTGRIPPFPSDNPSAEWDFT